MRVANGRVVGLPCFRHFFGLRPRSQINIPFTIAALSKRRAKKSVHLTGVIMEDTVQKSCWGVTIKALAGFAGIMALAYLFGTI